jgi:hypothetical protein
MELVEARVATAGGTTMPPTPITGEGAATPFDAHGKPPRQLTYFSDERTIVDFGWSRDGQHLAVIRVTTTSDVVLFKGLRR